jgi:hypothetical protein
MSVLNNGNVGIGTTGPTYGLDNQSTNATGTALTYNPLTTTGVTRSRWTPGAGQSTIPLLSTTGTSSLTLGVADATYLTLANGGAATFSSSVQATQFICTNLAEGTCDVTNRGRVVMVQGGAGVADTFRICAKDALNAYAWTALY